MVFLLRHQLKGRVLRFSTTADGQRSNQPAAWVSVPAWQLQGIRGVGGGGLVVVVMVVGVSLLCHCRSSPHHTPHTDTDLRSPVRSSVCTLAVARSHSKTLEGDTVIQKSHAYLLIYSPASFLPLALFFFSARWKRNEM